MSTTRKLKRSSSVVSNDVRPKIKKTDKEPIENGVIAYPREERVPGSVLVFGDGVAGQLGLGVDVTEKPKPSAVSGLDNVIEIVAGGMHSVCLTSDNKLITFGCNDEGALGRDTSEEGSETLPGQVDIPGKIVQISAGDSHSAVLLDSGLVYVFGTFRDSHGVLGLQKPQMEKLPILLNSVVKFTKIASGCHHIALLGVDGVVYTFGCGEQGQLGRLPERSSTRDARHGANKLLSPAAVLMKRRKDKLVDVWAGSYNTIAKDNEGNVHVWGLNNYNQLGIEGNVNFQPRKAESFTGHSWAKIVGGEHHTLALADEGQVYVLGRKEYGRLGLGENCPDAKAPTQVEVCSGKKVVDISCGSFTSFALTEEGKLYSWGMGSSMLGFTEEEDLWTPTLVKGKQLEKKKIIRVDSGGQHTIILVI